MTMVLYFSKQPIVSLKSTKVEFTNVADMSDIDHVTHTLSLRTLCILRNTTYTMDVNFSIKYSAFQLFNVTILGFEFIVSTFSGYYTGEFYDDISTDEYLESGMNIYVYESYFCTHVIFFIRRRQCVDCY